MYRCHIYITISGCNPTEGFEPRNTFCRSCFLGEPKCRLGRLKFPILGPPRVPF